MLVTMLSTAHSANGFRFVRRRIKVGGQWRCVRVRKPTVVDEYTSYMGGVDRSDQMLSHYNVLQKTMRWWKTLFFHMIDVAVVNSFILFMDWRRKNPEVVELQRPAGYSQLDYREELVRQLGEITIDTPVPLYQPAPPADPQFQSSHIPLLSNRRHNCSVCYFLFKTEQKCQFMCSAQCCQDSNAFFCLNKSRNCFQIWHSPRFDGCRNGRKAKVH